MDYYISTTLPQKLNRSTNIGGDLKMKHERYSVLTFQISFVRVFNMCISNSRWSNYLWCQNRSLDRPVISGLDRGLPRERAICLLCSVAAISSLTLLAAPSGPLPTWPSHGDALLLRTQQQTFWDWGCVSHSFVLHSRTWKNGGMIASSVNLVDMTPQRENVFL